MHYSTYKRKNNKFNVPVPSTMQFGLRILEKYIREPIKIFKFGINIFESFVKTKSQKHNILSYGIKTFKKFIKK